MHFVNIPRFIFNILSRHSKKDVGHFRIKKYKQYSIYKRLIDAYLYLCFKIYHYYYSISVFVYQAHYIKGSISNTMI